DSPVNERLFTDIVRSLLGDDRRWAAIAHPCVWVTVFDQREHQRLVVSLVNYAVDLPPVPVRDVSVTLRAPDGHRFADGDRTTIVVDQLDDFAMLVGPYV
ncbi:MAG: hypothetical protein WD826_09225, partial [Actinomycetota bacterium]